MTPFGDEDMTEPAHIPLGDSSPEPPAARPESPLWVCMAAAGPDEIAGSTDTNGPDAVRAALFRPVVRAIVSAGVEAWTAYLCALPQTECSCPEDHLSVLLWPDGGATVILAAADRAAFARRTFRTLAYLQESPTALNCAANFHPHAPGHPDSRPLGSRR
jgi:hypothetical protein